MAYIYQIQNDVNGKIYVGKTEFSIEKRFKEHCEDAYREHCEKRPLYAAMRKYGIEHFHISLLEETDNPEERECYWIEQLRSFKNGYNATIGGDGRKYLDYDLIIATYNKVKNQNEVARILKISPDSVHNVLKKSNIEILKNPSTNNKIVYQYDLNENFNSTVGDVKKKLNFTKTKILLLKHGHLFQKESQFFDYRDPVAIESIFGNSIKSLKS